MDFIFPLRNVHLLSPTKTNAGCTVEEPAYTVRAELEAFWFVSMVTMSTEQ